MKRKILIHILLLVQGLLVAAQTELDLIQEVLDDFILGTTYNYPDTIAAAFHPGTQMYLYNGSDTVWSVTSERYATWYSRRAPGTKNDRVSRIASIQVEGDVAYAKLEVDVASFGNRYSDLLLLKKIKGAWKIVFKCTSAEPIPKTPKESIGKPKKTIVMKGLKRPWSIAFLSEVEAIIAEKDGDLLLADLFEGTSKAISGLPDDVARKIRIDTTKHDWGVFPPRTHGMERSFNAGWFQVLLDPDFRNNQYIYVSYAAENSRKESTTKVIRGKLIGDQLTEVETLFLAEPYSHGLFHYGGGMIFGKDGKLYITIGERNLFEHNNPVPPLAQDVTDKRGKVIRINPDGSIPEDNPDFGPKAIKGLYATGIRASQGLTIHPETREIWFSEHGTMQGDELNILKPGANYGWPHKTSGGYRSEGYNPPVIPGTIFTDPNYYWDQTIAPTGLTFYSGRAFPQWEGDLIVPGLSKGNLWRLMIEDDVVVGTEELFIADRVRIRKAVLSPRGQLYLLTDEEDGKVILVKNANR